MRYGIVVLLAAAAAFLLTTASHAQNAAKDCEESSDDLKKVRACTEVLRRNPRDVKALRQRANAYSYLELDDKAIADISKVIEIEPRNAEAYSLRGEWYADEGDYEKAIADYDRSLALQFDTTTLQSRAYAHLGKGDFTRTRADATRYISENPDWPYGYAIRGRALLAMKSHKEAIADFQRAIQLDPQDSAFEKAMIQIAEVDAARAAGRPFTPKLAHTLCKQSYDSRIAIDACTFLIDGGDSDAYGNFFKRGLAYQDSGDQPRAIADFTAAIAREARGVPAYYQRANSNLKLGNLDAAIADLSHVLQQQPDHNDFRALRGDLYRRKGDHQRALEDYEILARADDWRDTATVRIEDAKAAIAAQPRQKSSGPPPAPAPEAKSAPAKVQAATPPPPAAAMGDCSHASQPDLAIVACGTAIQHNPQNVEALLVRAAAYHDKKAYDRAIADYTAAIKLQPKNGIIYNERGYAQFETREFDHAISDFSIAIELDPNYARAYLNRGLAYSARRAYTLAGQDFAQAVKRHPASAASIQPYIDDLKVRLSEASSTGAAPDRDACLTQVPLETRSKYTYPARIEVCSRAIGSGQFKSKELAKLFETRGYAYSLTDDRQNAIGDWDQLFELDPASDVDILFSRARLRMELKDREGATRDLRQYLQSTGRIPESERTMSQNQNRITATATLKLLGGTP